VFSINCFQANSHRFPPQQTQAPVELDSCGCVGLYEWDVSRVEASISNAEVTLSLLNEGKRDTEKGDDEELDVGDDSDNVGAIAWLQKWLHVRRLSDVNVESLRRLQWETSVSSLQLCPWPLLVLSRRAEVNCFVVVVVVFCAPFCFYSYLLSV
jgi:hypothetical protein